MNPELVAADVAALYQAIIAIVLISGFGVGWLAGFLTARYIEHKKEKELLSFIEEHLSDPAKAANEDTY